jgi:hypothetical protein
MTSLLSVTNCPAITIPCGFTSTGLPVGLQIVAAPFADEFVLAAAACLEAGYRTPGQPRTQSLAVQADHDTRKRPITPVEPYIKQSSSSDDIAAVGPRNAAAAAYHHGISVVYADRWPFTIALGFARAVVRIYHRR